MMDSLKLRLTERLIAPEAWTPDHRATHSDFDLYPGLRLGNRTLRPAAVLVPIIEYEDRGPTVLMTRRADSLTSHSGQVAFPGGRLDPGETAVTAALREAREEVALNSDLVEVLGVGDGYITGSAFFVTPVLGWLKGRPEVTPSPSEVAEVFEVPWAFLMDPDNHRRDHYDLSETERRWFWSMPYEQHYIWGVTAGIVRQLFHRLYGEEGQADEAVARDAL